MKRIYREGVCGLVFTPDQEKIVLIKRGDCGIWYLPGGHIEPGESKKEAVRREVKEETGLDFKINRLLGVYDFKVLRSHPFFWEREYVYLGVSQGGILTTNEEAKKVEYFAPKNIPRGLPYFQREYVSDAVSNKFHETPIIQGLELRGLIMVLATNPQLLLRPFSLGKKLTESS